MVKHECNGSIEAEVEIKYSKRTNLEGVDNEIDWRMFNYQLNYLTDEYELEHITIIKHCPFCGISLLNNSEEQFS